MEQLPEKVETITSSPVAHRIAQDVESGMSFEEVLEKYATSPALKHEIFYYQAQIEKKLRAGVPLKEVLDAHFQDEAVKAQIHHHVKAHQARNLGQ